MDIWMRADDKMIKNAWIFSLPIGGTDVMQAPLIPKYINDTLHGGSKDDPKRSWWRSAGMAGLAGAGTLFGLGFAGMGMRDLGLKLAVLSRQARKLPLGGIAQRELAHEMGTPAYTRFNKYMGDASKGKWYEKPARGLGTVAGGIAHPFNKLEDSLTSGLVKLMGSERAADISHRLVDASRSRLFDNVGVRAMSNIAAIPALVGGDMLFSPYKLQPGEEAWSLDESNAQKRAAYNQGYMDKMAQEKGFSSDVNEAFGVPEWASEASKMVPIWGAVPATYDAYRDVQNAWNAPTWSQKGGHLLNAAGNAGWAALSLTPATLLKGLKFLPKGVQALRGTKAVGRGLATAQASKPMQYLANGTQYQKNVFGAVPKMPWKQVAQTQAPADAGMLGKATNWAANKWNTLKGQQGNWGQLAKAAPASIGGNIAAHVKAGPMTQLTLAGVAGSTLTGEGPGAGAENAAPYAAGNAMFGQGSGPYGRQTAGMLR